MQLVDTNLLRLPGAKRALLVCGVLAVLAAACVVGQALSLSVALCGIWVGQGLASQLGYLALFAGCFCAHAAVLALRERLMGTFARTAVHELQQHLLESVYDQGTLAVEQFGSGALLTTLTQGSEKVRNYLGLIIPKSADLMVQTVVLGVALLVADLTSGIIALVVVPALVFYMQLLGGYAKEKAAGQYAAYQQLSNHFADSVKGIAALQDFGAGESAEARVFETSERLREKTIKTLKTATLSSLVLDLFSVFALAAVAIMLGFRLMDGALPLLNALVVLIVTPELFAVLKRWSADFHASLDGKNQLQAMLDVAQAGKTVQVDKDACAENAERVNKEVNKGALVSCEALAHFAMKDVAFSYDCDSGTKTALRDITFDVPACARVAIIGESGAGKSTLAQLLAGFATPDEGAFFLNGQLAPTLDSDAWRAHVTYIPQKPHIFHASLRDNVAFYCPEARDAHVWEALSAVGLADFAQALPQGLDTLIGEGALGVSGGQAQRIALARAFADARRTVVVFDEPTAHLDIETELALKPAMRELMRGRTVFFATHRLHWVADMDYVLLLEDGRVAAFDTLEQVKCSAAYARLAANVRGVRVSEGEQDAEGGGCEHE